jgi:hypothetical protein
MVGGVAALADQSPKLPPQGLFSYAEPGISPDGREIAFASGGDIWSVPSGGGDARLLVANDATERRPLFSPDGASLAFMSTRTGGGDIYVLSLASGAVRRVDVGRRHRAAGQLVGGLPVDLLQLVEPRHRGHERRLPRAGVRRHPRCP